jgi:hypothetical protein
MIGPAIPEALLKKKQQKNEAEIEIHFSEEEQEEQTVGPQIPAHILERKRQISVTGPQMPNRLMDQGQSEEDNITTSEEYASSIGPQIPQQRTIQQIGPSIPSHLIQRCEKAQNADEIAISDEEDDVPVSPQIPKQSRSLQVEEENPDVYAPALPPDLIQQRQQQQPQAVATGGRRRRPVGPTFPNDPIPSQDEDDDIVGPALPKDYNPEEEAKYSAILAIEERARQSKEALEKVTRKTMA